MKARDDWLMDHELQTSDSMCYEQYSGNLASPAVPSADAFFRTVRKAHDTPV